MFGIIAAIDGKLDNCEHKARGGCQHDQLRAGGPGKWFEGIGRCDEEKIDAEELKESRNHRQGPLPVVSQHGDNGKIDQSWIDERQDGTVKSHDE
jgi:hypothetical protein